MPPNVGFNDIGFWIPLLASSFIVAALIWRRGTRISRRSAISYAALALGIALVGVTLFVISPDSASLAIPPAWSQVFTFVAAVCYFLLFRGRGPRLSGWPECYVVGTYSMILVDAVRTYLIPLPVALSTVYWGGNGMNDLVFQFGWYMGTMFLFDWILYLLLVKSVEQFRLALALRRRR